MKKKRSRGRPPLSESQRRKARRLWVHDKVWKVWQLEAKRLGLSVSQWVQQQLEQK